MRGGGVAVEADGCEAEFFDEVVIAAHSDQALAMIADPTQAEREVLGAMRYERNEAALHTDASLMPRRKRAWASWNFHLTEGSELPTMSYWMNRLQGLDAAEDIFVTLNRTDSLDPEKVIKVIPYEHPIVTHEAVAAQRRWGEVSGADRIHFCGAYWRWGFHEDGCWSAIRACERLAARRGAGAAGGGSVTSNYRHLLLSRLKVLIRSAIYEGWVRHRRHDPVEHEFRYPLFMAYLDLDELPWVLDSYPGLVGPAPRARALQALGLPGRLRTARSPIAFGRRSSSGGGEEPAGPIRLLTNLRYFGHAFNPVSFYYCFDEAGERVESVLAEVTNTPWGERHSYLLGARRVRARDPRRDRQGVPRLAAHGHGAHLRLALDRAGHAGSGAYRLALSGCGATDFDATLSLERLELSRASTRHVLVRYPAMTMQVMAKIYWQSLRLWLKGVPYFPHPERG